MTRLHWLTALWPLLLVPLLHDPTPVHDPGTVRPAGTDTTYGDNRYVALVPGVLDTLTHGSDTTIRILPDIDSVGIGNSYRAVRKPGTTDTVFLVISYDTLTAAALDSSVVDSIWSAWGLGSPYAYAVSVPGAPPDAPPANYALAYSLNSDRSNPQLLSGASVSGGIYVFADTVGGGTVDSVLFYHADTLVQTERSAPYDFQGGAADTATVWQTVDYADGSHTIRADLYPDSVVRSATFTINNSGDYPNEPAGLTAIAQVGFADSINATTGVCNPVAQGYITWDVADATAPTGDGFVMRGRFPSGFTDGSSPWRFDCWGPGLSTQAAYDYSEVYISYWIKVEGTDYQNQSVGTKTHYMAHGSCCSRYNHSAPFLHNPDIGQTINDSMLYLPYIYEMEDDGSDAGGGAEQQWNFSNQAAAYIHPGQWQQVEVYYKVNDIDPAPYVDNGIFRLYIDGVQVMNLTDVRWRSSTNPYGFYYFQFTPVYGGNSGNVRTRDDYWRIDEVYISAKE